MLEPIKVGMNIHETDCHVCAIKLNLGVFLEVDIKGVQ